MHIHKLETTPTDLRKLTNVSKMILLKKAAYNELVRKVNAIYTIDTSDLVKKADYNTKIENNEKKTPNHNKV